MVLVVLGIDGLDSQLVKHYNLLGLKQVKHSLLDLSDFPVVVSPPIWASMITGVVFKDMLQEFTPMVHTEYMTQILGTLKRHLPLKFRIILSRYLRRYRDLLGENPMRSTSVYLSTRRITTIFDEYESWHNAIPGLDNILLAGMLPRDFYLEKTTKSLLLANEAIFKTQVGKLFEVLACKDAFELIFWYTNWIDFASHLEFGLKLKTMNRYCRINEIARQISEQLEDSDVLFIVSDHGFVSVGNFGIHSNQGFFSSSVGETIKRPKELYQLMKRMMRDN